MEGEDFFGWPYYILYNPVKNRISGRPAVITNLLYKQCQDEFSFLECTNETQVINYFMTIDDTHFIVSYFEIGEKLKKERKKSN